MNVNIQWLVPALLIAIALLLIIAALWRGHRRYPYQAAPSLFSAAELRFLQVLEKSITRKHKVYAKVRIADIVQVRSGLSGSRFFSAFNAIACKHVDYVICERATGEIAAVIELDDRSHDRPERQNRDAFVDAVMHASGLPILHIPVQKRYNVQALKSELDEVALK